MPNTNTQRQSPLPTRRTHRGSSPTRDRRTARNPSLSTPRILPSLSVIGPSPTLPPPKLPPVRDLLAFPWQALTSLFPPDASYGILPTPSPELDQASVAQDLFGNHGHSTWDALRPAHPVSAGTKRSHDYVEEFFTDMKKRRLTPSYDPRRSPCAIMTHVWLLILSDRYG